MTRNNLLRHMIIALTAVIVLAACRKRDNVLNPDNLVVFESAAQGMTASENSIIVKIKLSRGTDRDIPVSINFTPVGVVYGTDFSTLPAAVAGSINITVPSGNNEASFTVTKQPGALFDGDEYIDFSINSSGAPVLIGSTKHFRLSFAELVSNSSAWIVNGGGVQFPNKVFIDLSANRQTPVLRTNWDLGFYTDAADFKVILNSSVAMMAKQLAKNDLGAVTAADTIGLGAELAYSQFAPAVSQLVYVDYPNGDLSRTAIGTVNNVAAENKVYIVNRGSGVGVPAPARGWKKIRVLRNATGGYTLQHADIAATSFASVEIPKEAGHFFKYISFDNGPVSVEPEKTKWDLAWAYAGNVTNFGAGEVPYMFQDLVLQNRNVQVAKVMTATKAYADFTEANLSDATIPAAAWSGSQLAIGADWRSGGGPGTAPAVRTDRYYIIRDGNNNYYKLRFTSLTDNGVRGYPSIEYGLLRRG